MELVLFFFLIVYEVSLSYHLLRDWEINFDISENLYLILLLASTLASVTLLKNQFHLNISIISHYISLMEQVEY